MDAACCDTREVEVKMRKMSKVRQIVRPSDLQSCLFQSAPSQQAIVNGQFGTCGASQKHHDLAGQLISSTQEAFPLVQLYHFSMF